MGFAPKKVKKPKVLPPQGVQPARLVWLVDFGTQRVKGYKGAPDEDKQQIMLFFEFPMIKHVFDEEKGEQPFGISQTFTYSLDEKANLSKFLEQWFGRKLTEKERKDGYDLSTLVGKTCIITIIHNPDKNDPTIKYANIGKIELNTDVKVGDQVVKSKVKLPPAINPIIKFSLDEKDWAQQLEKLPQWMQKKVKASKEWQSMGVPQGAEQAEAFGGDSDADEDQF